MDSDGKPKNSKDLNIETFQCEHCKKSFKKKNEEYFGHIQQKHIIKRPFSCHLCPSAFALRRYLCDHVRRSHGVRLARLEHRIYKKKKSKEKSNKSLNVSKIPKKGL